MKELSLIELQRVNGGARLPEVVCIGHRKSYWDYVSEAWNACADYWSGYGPF